MTKKTDNFIDPLQDMDPVMEEVFLDENTVKTPAYNNIEVPIDQNVDQNETKSSNTAEVHNISQIQFPILENHSLGKKIQEDVFGNIPVNVSVELGRSEMSLKEIYELTEGSIIELERLVGEPLDLVVNGQIIAQGEVVAVDNNYGLRLTNIIAKNRS